MKQLRNSHTMQRTLRIGESQTHNVTHKRLEIRYRDDTAYFVRNNYGVHGQFGGHQEKNIEPDTDLRTLIVLFIGKLVPAGVLADRIEEDHPELVWVAEFLREWDSSEVDK